MPYADENNLDRARRDAKIYCLTREPRGPPYFNNVAIGKLFGIGGARVQQIANYVEELDRERKRLAEAKE